jgi:hypothetical protein
MAALRPSSIDHFIQLRMFFPLDDRYRGTREQQSKLRDHSAGLIARYVKGIQLNRPKRPTEPWVTIDPELEKEVYMWKQLTWHYIILNEFSPSPAI